MASHELEYEILGHSAQSVEIILDPGETVIAEAGAMNYMMACVSRREWAMVRRVAYSASCGEWASG